MESLMLAQTASALLPLGDSELYAAWAYAAPWVFLLLCLRQVSGQQAQDDNSNHQAMPPSLNAPMSQ